VRVEQRQEGPLRLVCTISLIFSIALAQPASPKPEPQEMARLDPGKGINWYSREKEAAMGAHYAKDLRSRHAVVHNYRVVDYLGCLADRLARGIPGSEHYSWTFGVVADSGGTSTREPVAAPGGYIFVTADLVTSVDEEAELAGMLAHAMAHVAARHGTRQATRGQIANLSTIPLIFMGGWGNDWRDGRVLVPAGFLQFQREFEREADLTVVRAMAAAGFDPSALRNYIARTQKDPANPAHSGYPPREERLTSIEQAIQALPRRSYGWTSGDFDRIRAELHSVTAPTPRRVPRLAR
jgi:predicted Zn-dependent protease